jgi:cold shock CspA family protein
MLTGYVRQFLPDRAFGFIRATDETDYFFHVSDWDGNPADIVRYARVTFDTVQYRIRATNEQRTKAIHISLIAPKVAPAPQPEVPYEPAPAAPSAPKQPRIAGQAKTILSTDDRPRPASALASPDHAVTAAATLAEATAPKTNAPNDGGIRE